MYMSVYTYRYLNLFYNLMDYRSQRLFRQYLQLFHKFLRPEPSLFHTNLNVQNSMAAILMLHSRNIEILKPCFVY